MNPQQYGPMAKFPGLSTKQVDELERLTDGLTGMGKLMTQGKLYQMTIAKKQQEKKKEDRFATTNEYFYKGSISNTKEEKNNNDSKGRMETLANLTIEKFGLDASSNTEEVVKSLMGYAKDKGVSLASMNNYLEKGDEKFLEEIGFTSKKSTVPTTEKKGPTYSYFSTKEGQQGIRDVAGGVVDSFFGLSKFLNDAPTEVAAWIAKKLGANPESVDTQKEEILNKSDKFFNDTLSVGQNRDDFTYKASNFGADILQLATGNGEMKIAQGALSKLPKIQKLIKTAGSLEALVKEMPVVGKMIVGGTKYGIEGAKDMVLYNAINGEGTSLSEAGEGGLINIGLGAAGKIVPSKQTISNIAKNLEVSGLVNKKTIQSVNNELKNFIDDSFEGVRSAGNWLLERGFKGDKEQIVKQLNDWAATFKQAKNELLDKSTSTIKTTPSIEKAISGMLKKYEGTLGNEEKVTLLKMLQTKTEWNAKELDRLKGLIDESRFHVFKTNATEADTVFAEGFANLRRDIKKDVEKLVEKDGLGNIEAINKEIQVSKTFVEGIEDRLATEIAAPSVPETIHQGYVIISRMLGGTENVTSIANMLAEYTGMNKKTLAKQLQKHGKFDEEFLKSVLPKDKSKLKTFMDNLRELFGEAAVADEVIAPTSGLPEVYNGTSVAEEIYKDSVLPKNNSLIKDSVKGAAKQEVIGNTNNTYNKNKKRN